MVHRGRESSSEHSHKSYERLVVVKKIIIKFNNFIDRNVLFVFIFIICWYVFY